MNSINYLSVSNLSKTYNSLLGETIAIDNVNFKVNNEEFIGIIGPSGCGKSTILNILCGLDKDYSGNIELKKDIKIGYMLQEDALFPWLTIMDNVLLPAKIKHCLNDETRKYALELLNKYGMSEFKDKYPNALSGGMKQRVG